jgi:cytochrome P450
VSGFVPWDDACRDDPHPAYRALRDADTATWSEAVQGWLITRYADAFAVLRDPGIYSSDERYATQPRVRRRGNPPGRNVISSDPPVHTRLRRVLGKVFAPSSLAGWSATVAEWVETRLDGVGTEDALDVIADVAVPVPLTLISTLLGVPEADRQRFWRWSEDEIAAITPATPQAEAQRLQASSAAMHDYLRALVAAARQGNCPADTLVARLVAAADDHERLDEDELIAFVALLLRAGTTTVTHAIGNAVLAALRHPQVLARLTAGELDWPRAVDELLRFAGPVQAVTRVLREPARLHGLDLAAGERLFVVLASANRDERCFPRAEQLDLDRTPNEHLAFGTGIHHCLGAALGRLQIEAVLRGLLARMPDMELAVPEASLRWHWLWTLRGLAALPVRRARR